MTPPNGIIASEGSQVDPYEDQLRIEEREELERLTEELPTPHEDDDPRDPEEAWESFKVQDVEGWTAHLDDDGSTAGEKTEAASKPAAKPRSHSFIQSALGWQEWTPSADGGYVIGSPENALIRTGTKNFIEAPEKSFKTTFLMRLMLGLACGVTVFPQLTVSSKPKKVLYLHGELSARELKERTNSAIMSLPERDHELLRTGFFQGRNLKAHLIEKDGQKELRLEIETYKPDVLVLDPWQAFITGYDENSFKDMSNATKFLDEVLGSRPNMAIMIPIHLGKDRTKGARGHSTLAGWRDTLIRLAPGKNGMVTVNVQPRWADPPPKFKIVFRDGTVQTHAYAPQVALLRSQVERLLAAKREATGKCAIFIPRDDLRKQFAKMTDEAFRKMLSRGVEDDAIRITKDMNKDVISLVLEPVEAEDVV